MVHASPSLGYAGPRGVRYKNWPDGVEGVPAVPFRKAGQLAVLAVYFPRSALYRQVDYFRMRPMYRNRFYNEPRSGWAGLRPGAVVV